MLTAVSGFLIRLIEYRVETMPLTEWIDTEQQFTHVKLMNDAQKANKEQLIAVLDVAHKNYLIQRKLFNNLLLYYAKSGIHPPPLQELLEPRPNAR